MSAIRKWLTAGVSAEGKIVAVTGAHSGVGKETAKQLNLAGAKVYMLCRREEEANEAKGELVKARCDANRLIFVKCDLAFFKDVRQCAKQIESVEDHIDILLNCAEICLYMRHELTEDGHEMTWQCNYLGPFLLTELLLPLLKKSQEGRIINITDTGKEPLDLSTIDNEDKWDHFKPYARSKLANIMHAREVTKRLSAQDGNKITANSFYHGPPPTGPDTMLNNEITRYFKASLVKRDIAKTSVYLALSSEVNGVSGRYFVDCVPSKESAAALNDVDCAQLYEYSIRTTGLKIDH